MATIRELMPYLEQGYTACDPRRYLGAYLSPKKQGDSLVFEWEAYLGEGKWRGPERQTKDDVLTWESAGWSICCSTFPGGGGGTTYEDQPERIEQAIREGRAHKARGFE